jgi:glycosyltransferase involved in cell wall biosynthesis
LNLSPRYSSVIYPFLQTEIIAEKRNYRLGQTINSIFIGQLETHKGIFFLCDALKSYRQKYGIDIRLDVFGLSQKGMDRLISDKYGDFVSVMTNVDRSSLMKKLARYDLGFFPSLWEEPFGISQIEMMQSGLPVISTGRGGSGEVSNGNNILFYKYDNQEALCNVLHELLSTYEEIASKLGVNAREYVLKHHSAEKYKYEIENHLTQVCGKNLSLLNE